MKQKPTDTERLDWLLNLLDADIVINNETTAMDYIDFEEWDKQGGKACAEVRKAWRAAIDAALSDKNLPFACITKLTTQEPTRVQE